ncbi:UNVERIFIED_CONTAM: hypothetical protein FKN15_054623 [Acipenser sinensis]
MQGNLKKAYAAEAQVKCLANTADLLMAYLDGILQSAPLPEPVASELRLVLNRLLQISGFQGQALGLAVARRQLWLFKARVPDEDKSVLLDTPITPGHTFGSAVEEMLQRSHREHKVSQEIASMHPSRTLVVLIVSGNLSFLNWLTIVPSIACFDDASLGFLFRSGQGGVKHQVEKVQSEGKPATTWGMQIRRVANISVGLLIVCLSMPVVLNLVSSQQIMNTSFNPLRIVNTYGAFGRVGEQSVIVFIPYGKACLCCSSFEIDTYEQNEWVIHLAGRLLANDTLTLSLMAHNPFEGREPPRWVRGEHFRYKFSAPGGNHAAEGKWWIRRRIGPYFPPVNSSGLRKYFEARDWPHPDSE